MQTQGELWHVSTTRPQHMLCIMYYVKSYQYPYQLTCADKYVCIYIINNCFSQKFQPRLTVLPYFTVSSTLQEAFRCKHSSFHMKHLYSVFSFSKEKRKIIITCYFQFDLHETQVQITISFFCFAFNYTPNIYFLISTQSIHVPALSIHIFVLSMDWEPNSENNILATYIKYTKLKKIVNYQLKRNILTY